MIVVDHGDAGLRLIRQRDHAQTSAEIASRWRRPAFLDDAAWAAFLLGVRMHDDGWAAFDAGGRLDATGRPFDFKTIHTTEHVAIWRASMATVGELDPFAQLLVALHARFLYTHLGQDGIEDQQSAQVFVAELDALADRRIDALSREPRYVDVVSPHALDGCRRLFTLFDGLSLALAGGIGWIDEASAICFDDAERDTEGVAKGGADGGEQDMRFERETRADSNVVRVTPWPFDSAEVEASMTVTDVVGRRFADAGAMHAAMAAGTTAPQRWTFLPG